MEAKQTVDYHKKIDLRCPQLDKVDFRGHTTPQFDFQVSAENKEQAPIREQTYPPEYYLALKTINYHYFLISLIDLQGKINLMK